MKTSTTTRTWIAGSLWALTLAACDDPDAPGTADETTSLETEDAELQDLPIDEVEGPPAEAPPVADEFTAETPEAKGVCSHGEWEFEYVSFPCKSCWHSEIGQYGWKLERYWRFCYRAPSPPSCGCEPPTLYDWSCNGAGTCEG